MLLPIQSGANSVDELMFGTNIDLTRLLVQHAAHAAHAFNKKKIKLDTQNTYSPCFISRMEHFVECRLLHILHNHLILYYINYYLNDLYVARSRINSLHDSHHGRNVFCFPFLLRCLSVLTEFKNQCTSPTKIERCTE